MRIKFLGAAGTVTGSSYVLTSHAGQSIMVDLGMFQGTEEIEELNFKKYDYDTSQLIGAVLTHAHLDHCGRLPLLLKGGFRGNIWMTPPTAEMAEISLYDSAKIAKQDKARALYDANLVERTVNRFLTVDYGKTINIGNFTVTFRDAGHILGSSSIEIIDKSNVREMTKVVFSGDLGNTPEYLVAPTETIDSADVVVMESTYGDKMHPDENPEDIIQAEINAVEETGATLLIPAFSMERTQELLHIIKHLKADEKIEYNTPVYMDGPMAEKVTAVYLDYPNYMNDHIQKEMVGDNPFDFPGLIVVGSHKDSMRLQEESGGPQVIIAGSGMMSGGRIVGHAAHFLPMESTRLLIVGYQGEETLGRELWEGKKKVVIDDAELTVRATISDTQAMSSHAGQNQLLDWLRVIKGVKKVFLTHGENEQRKALAEKITKTLNISDITLPHLNEEVVF